MPLQRSVEITSEGCSRRSSQKAGGAGHARECAKGAAKARQAWMQALEPQLTGQGRGQKKPRAFQPPQKTVQGSAIHGSHDHVDGTENGHDVGHLVSLEDVGKDLEVVAIGSPDLEAPRGDVIVALQEHANFAFA